MIERLKKVILLQFSKMKDKFVLITGTTNGIGKDLEKIYLSKNFKVISLNRIDSNINKTKNVYNYNIDITKEDEIILLFKKLHENNLDPDIFIFNAGINKIDFDQDFDIDNFNEVIETNFFSVMFFCNHIKKLKYSNKKLIFISSFSTIFPNKNSLGYYFSKLLINRYFHEVQKNDFNNNYKLFSFGPINTKIKRFIKNENKLNKLAFSFLSISSFKAAKVIFNHSISNRKIINYPYRVYLFYKLCRLIKTFTGNE